MADLFKILADNQREMFKLIVPSVKKPSNIQDMRNSDSENENVFQAPTSLEIE